MSTPDGVEPVADDEVLYRRVPVSQGWFDKDAPLPLSPESFGPRKEEKEGISLYRAKYKTLEEVSQGLSKKGYYVAKLRAGDVRALGITLRPDDPTDPAHVSVPELNSTNRDTDQAQEIKFGLAQCVGSNVEGPFSPAPPSPP